MANWSWELQPKAEKNLADFSVTIRRQVIDKLDWLADNFDLITPISLQGEFKEFLA